MNNYALMAQTDSLTNSQFITGPLVTNMWFTVRAFNFYGESLNSNIGTIPSQGRDPVLISSTSTSLKIRWDPSEYNGGTPIISYKVYYDIG
jgi:hypothetical protein